MAAYFKQSGYQLRPVLASRLPLILSVIPSTSIVTARGVAGKIDNAAKTTLMGLTAISTTLSKRRSKRHRCKTPLFDHLRGTTQMIQPETKKRPCHILKSQPGRPRVAKTNYFATSSGNTIYFPRRGEYQHPFYYVTIVVFDNMEKSCRRSCWGLHCVFFIWVLFPPH